MVDRQAFQEKMEAQIKEWSAKLDVLKAKSEKASADVKIQYQQQIQDLHARKEEVQTKLRELKNASEGVWENLKSGIENAWNDIKKSIDDAMSNLR